MTLTNAERARNYRKRHPERVYAAVRTNVLRWRSAFSMMKLERGCADCGYNADPRALDWDHRDRATKIDTVSQMLRMNRPYAALSEADKCDVRCANCHRIRTWSTS